MLDVPAWLSAIGITETVLQAAAIQSFFGVLGIVLAGLIAAITYGANRRADRQVQKDLRRERTLDLQSAIRAEVRAHWYELDRSGPLEVLAESMVERIDAGRWTQPSFTPFIVREAPTILLGAIESDLALLGRLAIQPTMEYYRQLALLNQFAEDLRTSRFEALAADRKIEMVRAYFASLRALKRSAANLNAVLEQALKLRPRDRDPNMRVGGPEWSDERDRTPASRSLETVLPAPETKQP